MTRANHFLARINMCFIFPTTKFHQSPCFGISPYMTIRSFSLKMTSSVTVLAARRMACACVLCGIAWRISFYLTSRQALWPMVGIGSNLAGCFDYYLLHKRREATLALGKGLDFAMALLLNHSPGFN